MRTVIVPKVTRDAGDLFSYVIHAVENYSLIQGKKVNYLGFSDGQYNNRVYKFLRLIWHINKLDGPFYCHSIIWLPLVIKIVKFRKNSKIIFWLCNDGTSQIKNMPLRKRIIEKLIGNFSLRASSIIVTCSPWVKDEILKYYSITQQADIRLIPNYVYNADINFSNYKFNEKRLNVAFISSLQPRKGFEVFELLTNMFRSENEHVRFIIRGSGTLKQQKRAIQIDPDYAKVKNSDAKALLRQVHFLVVPAFYQGFGRIYLEAMANDCITILPDIPSVRAWVTEYSTLSDKEKMKLVWCKVDHSAIYSRIMEFTSGSRDYEEVLTVQRKLVSHFTEDRILPLWFEVFNDSKKV
jgi:hypothetical protein